MREKHREREEGKEERGGIERETERKTDTNTDTQSLILSMHEAPIPFKIYKMSHFILIVISINF